MTGLIGLLQVELPSHTAYLCDGGFIEYDGNTYTTNDSVLGTIASISPMAEGIGGDIPALDLEFSPPSAIAITDLTSGAIQRNTVKLWQAEYDRDTGLIVGTPELQFIGQLDQPAIRFSKSEYIVSISVVSKAEWFFELDIGNTLSSSFHKYLYAGETGHDNATGLSIPIAWGSESPPSGSAGVFRGTGGFWRGMYSKANQS